MTGSSMKLLMSHNWRRKLHRYRKDFIIGFLIFVVALTVFVCSPVRPFSDSAYTFLVSESLLKHRSFAIDQFGLPRFEPRDNGIYVENGQFYQLEWVRGRLYYYPPPGSSVLSIPYVAFMDFLGLSVINKDGTYSLASEIKLQEIFAAFLMALLGSVFYFTSRLILPAVWSVIIALGGTLGTQVWSTLSGSMWSDTWGTFLIALVVWMVLADAQVGIRLRPILLGTVLAWTYFVRPTNAIPAIAVTIYVIVNQRALFVRYAITGLIWLAVFILYSTHTFGHLLPTYYRASRLRFEHFGEALAGNLISPSRGLLIYMPVTFFIFYLLARYRRTIAFPSLVVVSLSILAVHWIVTSAFSHWYGGGSYGPRLMAGIIPWLVLLAVLGVQAMLKARGDSNDQPQKSWRLQNALGMLLLLVSISMNGIGAMNPAIVTWNNKPVRVDRDTSRLWDWRYPQFLAGFLLPPPPKIFPPAEVRIDFSRKSATPYLWYGWSEASGAYRWTEASKATVVFSLEQIADAQLRMKFMPWIVSEKLNEQRVNMSLNGRLLETLILKNPGPQEYSRDLPKAILQLNNVLLFELPNATSPKTLGVGDDARPLALGVFWLEIKTQNADAVNDKQKQSTGTQPLTDGGYMAEIEVIDSTRELRPGESLNLRVKVKNVSGAVWPGNGQNDDTTYRVRLGNHWLDARGRLITLDDGRTALPYDL